VRGRSLEGSLIDNPTDVGFRVRGGPPGRVRRGSGCPSLADISLRRDEWPDHTFEPAQDSYTAVKRSDCFRLERLPGSPLESVETSVTLIAIEINTVPKAIEFVLNAPADVLRARAQFVEAVNEAAALGRR
jgi:hypothetical protein